MADDLTTTGLTIDNLETRKNAIKGEIHNRISSTMNLEDETPEGELVGIFAEREQAIMELIQEVYAGSYPDTAGGFQLTMVSTFTGTTRREATKTQVTCTVNVNPGTYGVGTLIGYIDNNPDQRFSNTVAVVNGGGSPANYDVNFECEDTGPIPAYATTLDNIAEPIVGFNSINNAADHTLLGQYEELDSELRIRRNREVAQGGSTSSQAITAELSAITGVIHVNVIENETEYYDVFGLPPHSIAVSIYAPTVTDQVIAEAIFDLKASGIQTHGSSNYVVTDDYGFSHNVEFSRVSIRTLYIEMDLETSDTYVSDTDTKEQLADYSDETFGTGDDILWSKLYSFVSNIQGVADINYFYLDIVSPPISTVNIPIAWNEMGNLDTANITIV